MAASGIAAELFESPAGFICIFFFVGAAAILQIGHLLLRRLGRDGEAEPGRDNFLSLHLNSPPLLFCFQNIQEVERGNCSWGVRCCSGFPAGEGKNLSQLREGHTS